MENDPLYAVRENNVFRYHEDKTEFISDALAIDGLGQQSGLSFSFRVSYLRRGVSVPLEDLMQPTPKFDSVRVTCRASDRKENLTRAFTVVYAAPRKDDPWARSATDSHKQKLPGITAVKSATNRRTGF